MTRVEVCKKSRSLKGLSICFDLDGTLGDTVPDLVRVTNDVIATEGITQADYAKARSEVGLGSRHLISSILARAGHRVDPARFDAMQADFLCRYADDIAQLSTHFPGVVDTLQTLRSMGASLSVCTNKPSWLARPLPDALDMTVWFDRIVDGDEAPRSKPDPRHVFMAAGHHNAPRIVLVGDGLPDIAAARNANALGMLVTYGYSHEPQIRLRADVRLRNFRALTPTLLDRYVPAQTRRL